MVNIREVNPISVKLQYFRRPWRSLSWERVPIVNFLDSDYSSHTDLFINPVPTKQTVVRESVYPRYCSELPRTSMQLWDSESPVPGETSREEQGSTSKSREDYRRNKLGRKRAAKYRGQGTAKQMKTRGHLDAGRRESCKVKHRLSSSQTEPCIPL